VAEKEFSVIELQKPMPVKKTLRDWLMLALIILFCAALILSVDVLVHHQEDSGPKDDAFEEPSLVEKAAGTFSSLKTKFKSKKAEILPEAKPDEKALLTEGQQGSTFKTPDSSGNVYLSYNNLHDLKNFIEQYDKEKKLTKGMKQMPEVVQKLGLLLYSHPKDVSRNDVVKVNNLLTAKHDYVSYNDMVLVGSVVVRQLKRDFNETQKPKFGKGKVRVVCMHLNVVGDVNKAIDEVRHGNIVILNANPLYKIFNEDMKRAISKLKNTCDAIGGTILMTNDKYVFASGSNVKLSK
jgi:SepF-like predicted cell division protein (DUF552 family)